MGSQAAPAFFDRLDSFLYRNRHWLGPIGVACGLAVFSLGLHHWHLWWVAAVVSSIVWVLQWPDTIDLPDWREKCYALGCWTAGGGWLVAASAWGPFLPMFGVNRFPLYVLAVIAMLGGVPWYYHQRVRRGVDVDRTIPAWGDGSAVGLPGTAARGTKADKKTFSFKIHANEHGHYTFSQFRSAAARIAALYRVHEDAVTVRRGGHAGEAYVTIRQGEVETVKLGTSEATTIVGPHRVGAGSDGSPLEIALYIAGQGGKPGAVVGTMGSGKSGIINRIAKIAVEAPDAMLVIVDLSFGQVELRGWAKAAAAFAKTPAEAEVLFDKLIAICEDRGERMKGRVFEPTPEEPAIVMLIDEGAGIFSPELLPVGSEVEDIVDARDRAFLRADKFLALMRQVRKYAIAPWEATQYGDASAFGGEDVKGQLLSGYGLVFRCGKNEHGALLVPGSMPREIPADQPGTVIGIGPTIPDMSMRRVEWVSDEDRDAVVAKHWDRQPSLEASAARRSNWSNRPRLVIEADDEIEASPARPALPDFTAALKDTPKRHNSADDSLNTVWMALASFPHGAGPTQVAKKAKKSVQIVSARLNELVADGRAEKPEGKRGVYVAVANDVAGLVERVGAEK